MIYEAARNYIKQGNYYINQDTGEAIHENDMKILIAPPDYDVSAVSPEEKERRKKNKEEEEKKKAKKVLHRSNQEPFVFVDTVHDFYDISAAAAAKLIYLATHILFDKPYLMETERTPFLKERLPEVLNISQASAWRFYQEVEGKYLTTDAEGRLCLLKNTPFIRGKIYGDTYLRVFIERVRSLYEITPSSKHKFLGYVFQLLQYINVEFNVLCKNPFEEEYGNIEFISFDEFCDLCGYDKEKRSRLIKAYSQLQFEINGERQPFVAIVTDGVHLKNGRIFINPNIMYSGVMPEHVKHLAGLIPRQ